ncbi:UNVERIFIED_CONTAM: hypothetical protein HDU68_009135 [Siphonaria sp. JEL0065]|nr:hypothetical protein HDU68_009135 [Siphonaria sp. JEL0065]
MNFAEKEAALSTANALLLRIGVGVRVSQLGECVSSLFVALFEGLVRVRLSGVRRNAIDRQDKINNVAVVLNAFEDKILGGRASLSHISPARVVDGNEDDLTNLLLLFGDLDSAIASSSSSASASATIEKGTKRSRPGTPTSPKKRKPVVAFSPLKRVEQHQQPASSPTDSSLPATIYADISSTIEQKPTKRLFPQTSPRRVSVTAQENKIPLYSASRKRPLDASKKNQPQPTSSIPLRTRSRDDTYRYHDSNLIHVVDDVERYVLTQARRQVDSDLNSTMEHAARLGTEHRKRGAALSSTFSQRTEKGYSSLGSGFSNMTNKPKTIRFHLNTTSSFSATPPASSRISSNALRILPTDTPHTRALKLRQQRLLAAKNEAVARAESTKSFVRQSLQATSVLSSGAKTELRRQKESALKKPKKHLRTSRHLTMPKRAASLVESFESGETSERRWWEGKGLFRFTGTKDTRSEDVKEEDEEEESFYNEDDDSNLSDVSPPIGFNENDSEIVPQDDYYFEDDSDEEGPRVVDASTLERRDSDSSSASLGSVKSYRSADIESFDLPSDIEGHQESFDLSDHYFYEEDQEKNSTGDSDENDEEHASPTSVTEQNFLSFEKLVKDELCIKKIPEAVKTTTWNGQLRDRRRALDSRLYQRKRNMHNEISTYSDIRPIQVLRKEVEQTAKAKRAKRERDAQRQAKALLTDQNRRVIRMEQRLSNAEREVEITRIKLARHLYQTYLSSQRNLIRETSRYDRDQRRAQEEAERVKREAKEAYARDQIRLLEEELKNAKWEEAIVSKAHAEEMRKLLREQKEIAKDGIQKIKNKLVVDENDFELQRAAAANVMRKLRFGVR